MNPEQYPFLPFPPLPFFFPLQNLELPNKDDSMKPFFQNFFLDPMTHEVLNQFLDQISQLLPPAPPISTNNEVILVEDSIRFEKRKILKYFIIDR